MTTIRPNAFPPPIQPGAAPAPDAGRLAAQRAFFAAAMGQAQPAAAQVQPAPEAAAPVVRPAATSTDDARKIPRPGSLFDIRV